MSRYAAIAVAIIACLLAGCGDLKRKDEAKTQYELMDEKWKFQTFVDPVVILNTDELADKIAKAIVRELNKEPEEGQ